MLGLKKSGYFDGIEEREDPKPEMMAADTGKYKKDKGNNEVREKEVVFLLPRLILSTRMRQVIVYRDRI